MAFCSQKMMIVCQAFVTTEHKILLMNKKDLMPPLLLDIISKPGGSVKID